MIYSAFFGNRYFEYELRRAFDNGQQARRKQRLNGFTEFFGKLLDSFLAPFIHLRRLKIVA